MTTQTEMLERLEVLNAEAHTLHIEIMLSGGYRKADWTLTERLDCTRREAKAICSRLYADAPFVEGGN